MDSRRIMEAVRRNFDISPDLYDEFEREHGLFRTLSEGLSRLIGVRAGNLVIDVGCGSGISTCLLSEMTGSDGRVIGIDNSMGMLKKARESCTADNIELLLMDASTIGDITNKADQVVFNASIFLIPDTAEALHSAMIALKPGGKVGMNFLEGLYGEPGGIDIIDRPNVEDQPFAPYGRRIAEVELLPETLRTLGFKDISTGSELHHMSAEAVRAFYSIPAQSAGLWPRDEYPERIVMLDHLMNYAREIAPSGFGQKWGWCIGRK